jgi:Tol biopolymer transport system component
VITGDTGSGTNLYRRNMDTGVTELLSPTTASATAGSGGVNGGIPPVLSDDGRYVTFSSTATNLVPTDTNGQEDVFLRDATANTTTLVSHNAAGTDSPPGGQSSYPRITPDGRYIVFSTLGTNLVASPADTAGIDIYRFDRLSGNNTLVTVSADGASSAGNPGNNTFPVVSDDGRYIAFESASTTLVAGFANNNGGSDDIFKRDMTAGTTSLVSSQAGSSTAGGTFASADPWITPDGRFVSFSSSAPEIVSPPTSSIGDVYVRGNFLPSGLSIATAPGANSSTFGFTGSATDPDGSISSFGWLFGDGASATGATTSHAYAASGSDTVTLTATDDDGESAQTTTSVSPAAAPSGGGGNNNGGGGDNNGGGGGGGNGGGTVSFAGTPKVSADGTTVTANVNCPGPGTLNGTLTSLGGSRATKKPVLGTKTVTVTKAGKVVLKVRLNTTGRKLLKKRGRIKAKLTIAFKPTTGKKQTRSKTVTLRAPRKKH